MGESWDYISVAGTADIFIGGTPKRSEPEYWGGVIKWASAKDIAEDNSKYIFNTEETITQEGLNNSSAKLLERDTLVITARGTVGAIRMLSEPMAFNQTCYGLVAKPEITDPHYLYYSLKSSLADIKALSYGTVFDTITTKTFHSLIIPLPPLPDQRRIAHILGTLDDKIELNHRMNRTLEDIARAIFKSWFVDFDPVRAKLDGRDTGLPLHIAALFPNGFVDSKLGKIPRGWRVKPIDEIADFLNGLALQNYPPENDEFLPVIKIRELRQGITNNTNKASVKIPNEYIIQDGDILFSWSGSLLVKIWTNGPGALNQHLFKVTSNKYPKWFYYFWLLEHLPYFQAIASGKATTMGHIKRNHLKEALTIIPTNKLIKEMNKIISPYVQLIVNNDLQSRTLAETRDTLLPKIIRGEIRVGDVEESISIRGVFEQ